MEKKNRTQLVFGILLIILAGWLIASRVYPNLLHLLNLTFEWPTWIMLAGGAILVIGLLVGASDMTVPACIVTGIGGILYYQNVTGNWTSWEYMWTLIPGFVGIGQILSGVIGGDFIHNLREGIKPLFISAVMFTIFATIFNAWTIFGNFSSYVPIVLLFLLGVIFIVRGFIHHK